MVSASAPFCYTTLFGSLERFTGILLEHHAGKLPSWLSPLHVVVSSITQQYADYAQNVAKLLRGVGLRAEVDTRNEKIGYKVREQTLQRIPFLLIAGAKEHAEGTIAIRNRDGQDLGTFELKSAIELLLQQCEAPDAAERRHVLEQLWAGFSPANSSATA
ncbi:His/Gly/Thr/Pro-type tRNA ligase C-terminal domain-containing protein [Pseudomonas helleri]|uniref:His/Gly/Thr/Pro-type tRNA ligase C-terminal domain-containing protein n=1 Tax=Pseudomonas helleri TaxID=1608996 RepID=UPI001E59EA1D|nr:His/Gly/Thr/Pro-type tRNA ligase C-terminal domain-containing protein [Pseudomonas helleri]